MASTTSKISVLLVGGTGSLGSVIARCLLEKNVELRLLVRKESTQKNKQLLDEFQKKGARIYEGNFMGSDLADLNSALEGVHTVISCLQGGEDVMIDGQMNIVRAAEAKGVKRFVPSHFSIDLFGIKEGDNFFLDQRRRFHNAFNKEKHSIQLLTFLIGFFIDKIVLPFLGILDFKSNKTYFWGDGNTKCDFITILDSAKYVAEVVCSDPEKTGIVQFAGEELTFNEFSEAISQGTGRKIETVSKGSVEQLKKYIDEAAKGGPFAKIPTGESVIAMQYLWGMVSGAAKLQNLSNKLYSIVKPQTVKEWMTTHSQSLQ